MIAKFQVLNLEITNACNYRCNICGDKRTRPIEMMGISEFHSALNTLALSKKSIGEPLPELRFFVSGEPTTHPQFINFIIIANTLGFDCLIHTNGSLWTKTFSQVLTKLNNKQNKVSISFSLDGYDEDSYEASRGVRNYTKVVNNIKDHIEEVSSSHNIYTTVQSILPKNTNENVIEDLNGEYTYMFGGAQLYIRLSHNWDMKRGSIKGSADIEYGKQCFFPFTSLIVYSNWQVGKCCADLNARCTYGNLFEFPYNGSLERAFFCKQLNDARNNMLAREHIEHCCDCERYGI